MRKKWLWLALILISAIVLGAFLIKDPGPAGVAVSLLGYTNAPTGGPRPFALLSVTNHERVAIFCRSILSEIEGGPDDLAPVMNRSLPWPPFGELKPGEGKIFAVGQPTEVTGKWRIRYFYERRTIKQLIKDFTMKHAGTFPLSLLRLSSTTPPQLCTNTSIWLEAGAH
jgi:hypothetical protein